MNNPNDPPGPPPGWGDGPVDGSPPSPGAGGPPGDPGASPDYANMPPPDALSPGDPSSAPQVPWMPYVPPDDPSAAPIAPPQPPPDEPKPPSPAAFIIAVGVTAMLVLYTIGVTVAQSYTGAFFAFPFFVGFIVSILSAKHAIRNTLISVLVGLAILIAVLREGMICVMFALPLIIGEMAIGALCAIPIRRYIDTRRKKIATISAMMLISIGWQITSGELDDPAAHPVHRVESEIVIAAPPERVFEALTSTTSVSGAWPWMIRIGLPIPRRLVIDEPGVDGSLRMEFNHGTAHARVTAWEPGKTFAFQVNRYEIDDPPFFITRLGRGEHYGLKTERVDDWLTLREIRYTFARDDEGRTRLRRSTVFQRHLFPDLYFGWLEQTIMQRGQDRLLELIRENVEPTELDVATPVAAAP